LTDRCVLCGSADARPLFTASDRLYRTTSQPFTVAACGKCGMLRLSPPPADLAPYYPETYWFSPGENVASRAEEGYRRLVLRDHLAFIVTALRDAPGPLLDVGCGGGLLLKLLRDRGFRGIGFDFSKSAAAVAWRQNGVPVMCGLLPQAPLRPASFGAVTMFHVVEHLPDPQPYLDTARDLLAPNGRLILQTPNAASWQARIFGRRWNGLDVPRHLHNYRAADLKRLLERSGFEIVREKHFSLRDNPPGLATTLAPSLDPMARRVRRVAESGGLRLAKDLIYFGLVVASLPFAAMEATFRAGATVMLEARKRA
jgi:2-polyprenyl-3-methyl-5-hydroxy-6-metoxy-1,4-benzoquinol methylase